jgi:hypothetical protein
MKKKMSNVLLAAAARLDNPAQPPFWSSAHSAVFLAELIFNRFAKPIEFVEQKQIAMLAALALDSFNLKPDSGSYKVVAARAVEIATAEDGSMEMRTKLFPFVFPHLHNAIEIALKGSTLATVQGYFKVALDSEEIALDISEAWAAINGTIDSYGYRPAEYIQSKYQSVIASNPDLAKAYAKL